MEENCKVKNKPKTFKELIRSSYFWKPVTSVIIGGALGFVYYYYEVSASDSSGITGNAISSVILGGAMGWFFVNRPCKSC